MPGDEDPIPADGNPHPMHGAPLAGNPDNFQNWQHDHAGAGGQVLGDAGIDVQMMVDVNAEINQNQVEEIGNLINEQDDVEDALMEDVEENWVPQHLDQPQDTITFNQSGSTANYLRANGPDIHLSVEEVLATIQKNQNEQNNANSFSSEDSEGVTSETVTNVVVPAFILKACQKLPVDCVMPVSQVVEWKEDIQKMMVPAQPVMDCILIRFWVFLFGESAQARILGGPISIPTVVSERPSSKTPLVDTMVRRSPRINPNT
jgi:hypothetical protein